LKKTGIAPQYTEEVTSATKVQIGRVDENEEQDELFDDSVRIVCTTDRASASLLQRKLKIGYARAARILDQMEKIGIVGPGEGAKARDISNDNAQKYLASKMGQE
jgi:S-DNA-T family DNA segregation ATPase FtsK/SpoIIIE